MTDRDHGPGVEWLAARAGMPADELLRDGTALGRALETTARDGLGLARRLMSADPEERRRAQVEARALRARFAADDSSPGERFAARIAAALRLAREQSGDSTDPQ